MPSSLVNKKKQIDKEILDEAPLFAGLEGCVIQKHEKTPSEQSPKVIDTKSKKKTATKEFKKISATKSPESEQTKIGKKAPTPKPVTIDPDAILLSIREMCLLLKISRATLVRMDNSGRIPGRMKLGGSVRFHRATVVNWLESMISSPTPF